MTATEDDAGKPSRNHRKTGKPRGRPRAAAGIDPGSPEFQAAVAAAAKPLVDAALADITSKFAALRNIDPQRIGAEDVDWIQRLALEIAEVSDQGTNRKRVAPDILAKQAVARKTMMELVVENRATKTKCEYRVIAKTYINEILIDPYRVDAATKKVMETIIYYDGIPNECMVPINEAAADVHRLFLASIGGVTKRARGDDMRPLSVTPGGLSVRGLNPSARRQVGNLADSNNGTPFDTGLELRNSDPRAKEVAVLGTVAPKARQTGAST